MKTEVSTGPVVAAVPYVAPATVQAGPGAPRLHIELTRRADVKLYTVTGEITMSSFRTGPSTGITYSSVCAAPCDCVIDGRWGQSFDFNGDGSFIVRAPRQPRSRRPRPSVRCHGRPARGRVRAML